MTNPANMIDFYKTSHRVQYPDKTTLVFSNMTPRSSRVEGIKELVVFGIQYFCREYLIRRWNEDFFHRPVSDVIAEHRRRLDRALGTGAGSVDHITELHALGYLPIEIRALPEGSRCPLRVPFLTIHNTDSRFFWLTNYLETILSCIVWGSCTSATTADRYRRILDRWAFETGGDPEFVPWQGHDFSFRGMMGLEAAQLSGAAHLLSFTGTDTVPAIDFLERYYAADADVEMIGGSVPATEHSVMSMAGEVDELETFRRLITKVHPSGIVSIVSDTWDFWRVLTNYAPALHEEIIGRNGKVVFRPDSGDPVKIICGDPEATVGYPAWLGAVRILWKRFGGTITPTGYRLLDPHVGLIYGDSITPERCEEICQKLAANGFASTNVVFGIGSYTYQHVTRDTYGLAVKATYGEVDTWPRHIFKCPVTDDGVKDSARGLLRVVADGTTFRLEDYRVSLNGPTWTDIISPTNALEPVFKDGVMLKIQKLGEIRDRLATGRKNVAALEQSSGRIA